MRWWTNFFDFRFKSTATAAIGIHPTKAWLSQLVNLKNANWTWGHFRRTICNKTLFCGKKGHINVYNASNCFLMRGVGGVRKSIHQSWLAKGLGLGLSLIVTAGEFQKSNLDSEERYAIKLCFKLGKNATETYGMLQTAFEASSMNQASVFEWHKRFKKGRESVRDDERCGRSKEDNTPELIGQRVRVRVTMLRF